MDPLEIASRGKIPASTARVLVDGISQQELESLIAAELGVPITHAQVSITRMNLVGSLRACGYIVEGGRNGRGKPYKIVGWAEKTYAPTADQWTGQPRYVLDWIRSFKPLSLDDEQRVQNAMKSRTDHPHESSFGYIFSYELARDVGWLFDNGSGEFCIVMQRFPNSPRFRLFNLNMSAPVLLELAQYIAQASTKYVSILNVHEDDRKEFKRLHSGGSFSWREEAVYRTEDIASDPKRFFGRRGAEMIRANDREIQYVEPNPTDARRVIEEWRRINEPKMRQLSITRDFVSIDVPFSGRIFLLGKRHGTLPVCIHILTPHASRSDMVSQLTIKELNYREQDGGRPGTGDWNVWKTCVLLSQRGIQFANVGGVDGGGLGLEAHKKRLTRPEDLTRSWTFTTSFTPGAPK